MEYNEYEGKNFLVTGGNGFIGSHIVESLLKLKANVFIVDSGHQTMNTNGVTCFKNKLSDINFWNFPQMDGIFHEASKIQMNNPIYDTMENAGAIVNLLEFATRWNCKIVVASTSGVFGTPDYNPIEEGFEIRPESLYATNKVCMEEFCKYYNRVYETKVVVLRYFNVYGEGQKIGVVNNFVSSAVDGRPLIVQGGLQTRDFLNIRDIVRANLLAYENQQDSGLLINIAGTGEEISIMNLAKKIIEISKSKSEIVYKTRDFKSLQRIVADPTYAREVIGYEADVSLDYGLQRLIEYCNSGV